MNIRKALYALITFFCFQAIAMDQEHVMALIQHGSPEDLREFAQAQCPTDSSFLLASLRNVTFEAIAALLIKDKLENTDGKVVAAVLGFLAAAEGVSFMGNVFGYFAQKAQQEKLFQYFMNIRKGMEMRKQALDEGDSEEAGE